MHATASATGFRFACMAVVRLEAASRFCFFFTLNDSIFHVKKRKEKKMSSHLRFSLVSDKSSLLF